MSGASAKTFNLPWHQYDQYWITLFFKGGSFAPILGKDLAKAGMQPAGDAMTIKAPKSWKPVWDTVYAVLANANMLTGVEVSVAPDAPPAGERKTPEAVQNIAQSLWIGEALLESRILCYLQPVLAAKDKVFGYESFARVKATDGTIIGGDKIVAASRALNIEHMIDRHLHIQAIKTFVSSDFNGFLFINFFPGFIHRPAVYLEGLSETAKNYGIIAKHLVLDFTRSENPHSIAHLKSVCEYGRSRGYSVALDDIESLEGAKKLIPEMRPDFVKIDMHLVRQVTDPAKREVIRQIVEFVHASGSTVIAEGVETEAMHTSLKQLGVDLFQGYYFSPPVPVEAALKRGTGTH